MSPVLNPTAVLRQPWTWFVPGTPAAPAPRIKRASGVCELAKDETLVFVGEQDHEIVCIEGRLWITLDSDPTDHVLEAGERFAHRGSRRMLVHAVTASRFRTWSTANR